MADQAAGDFVLGIDLGSNSLGWALIERKNGKPVGLLRTDGHAALGACHFESATEGDRESGKEETRNVARRQARLGRRQILRRSRRTRNVFRLLQSYELLPSGNAGDPIERQKLLNRLDQELPASEWFKTINSAHGHREPIKGCSQCHRLRQVMPYLLRASALRDKLEKTHLGLALRLEGLFPETRI